MSREAKSARRVHLLLLLFCFVNNNNAANMCERCAFENSFVCITYFMDAFVNVCICNVLTTYRDTFVCDFTFHTIFHILHTTHSRNSIKWNGFSRQFHAKTKCHVHFVHVCVSLCVCAFILQTLRGQRKNAEQRDGFYHNRYILSIQIKGCERKSKWNYIYTAYNHSPTHILCSPALAYICAYIQRNKC